MAGVKAGTSFGVSTIYFSLAVGTNLGGQKGKGRAVEGAAAQARRHWEQFGDEIKDFIELREGDLLETLKKGLEDVDLLPLDIWAPLALPTLKTVLPKLRPGAVVLVDNSAVSMMPGGYNDLLANLRQEGSGFSNLTVPYSKGLEMCIYLPRNQDDCKTGLGMLVQQRDFPQDLSKTLTNPSNVSEQQ